MDLDKEITSELRKDPEASYLAISRKLKVSEGTIRNRVKKLKESRRLRFSVQLASSAFIEVSTNARVPTTTIATKIQAIGAERVFEAAGRFSIGVLVSSADMQELNDTIEKIRSIPGVLQTETFPILKQ
jgi:Lrp/AsnC family transcriptional regulator, leucine-responsive regulatory protein